METPPLEPLTLQPATPQTAVSPKPAVAKPLDLSDTPEDLSQVAHTRTVSRTIPANYGDYFEMRLGLNLANRTFTTETDTGIKRKESFDRAGGGTLRLMGSPGLHSIYGGLIYGGGIGWEGGTRNDPIKIIETYDFYSIDGLLGYGYPFSRRVQLEILGGLGLGYGQYYVNHVNDFSGSGLLYELSSNLMYTTREGYQGGLHLGYAGTKSTLTGQDGITKLKFSTSGLEVGFILGGRF